MVVSVEQLVAFGLTALLIIAVPGPSVVFVVGRALSYGRGVALLTVVGNTAGLVTVAALVSAGLGAVVAESVVVFTAVKYAGAAYLLWLGISALRHRSGIVVADQGPRAPLSGAAAVRHGFLVGVSNPKGFMMFAAVLPQFVDRHGAPAPGQMLVLGALAATIGMVCDATWALAASRFREWFGASERRGKALGTAGGCSMIGVGVALAVSGHPE